MKSQICPIAPTQKENIARLESVRCYRYERIKRMTGLILSTRHATRGGCRASRRRLWGQSGLVWIVPFGLWGRGTWVGSLLLACLGFWSHHLVIHELDNVWAPRRLDRYLVFTKQHLHTLFHILTSHTALLAVPARRKTMWETKVDGCGD